MRLVARVVTISCLVVVGAASCTAASDEPGSTTAPIEPSAAGTVTGGSDDVSPEPRDGPDTPRRSPADDIRSQILRQREHARSELGGRFDNREFHDAILGHGSVPLALLDEVVATFIAENS